MDGLDTGLRLLKKICEDYSSQQNVMQGIDGEYDHALDVLRWAKMLYGDIVPTSLALAAVFHDIDRIVTPNVGGGFDGDRKSAAYRQHKKEHAKRSAAFTRKILEDEKIDAAMIQRTCFLILHHDDDQSSSSLVDDRELETLIAADSFAFFTTIAPTLYREEGSDRIKDKISFMIHKLTDAMRAKLWETKMDVALFDQMKNDAIRKYNLTYNPREKEYNFCPSCSARLVTKHIDHRDLRACPECSFVFWNSPVPVASIVLARDNKILMVQRAQKPLLGYWCLPGGYIDYGEQPYDAAIRETKEEVNLDVQVDGFVGVYVIDNDPRGANIDLIYSGHMVAGEIYANEEVSHCAYFPLDSLPDKIAYKHREAIREWQISERL